MHDDVMGSRSSPGRLDTHGRRAVALIAGARQGDAESVNELISLIYPELKRRARWLMAGERPGHTFGASGSELVQRVMEKILATEGQIFNVAGTEEDLVNLLTGRMRFILVDYARAAAADRRPCPRSRLPFEDIQRSARVSAVNIEEVLAIDEILTKLATQDADAARALELRFFAGLTNEEAAGAMDLSVASFRRTLRRATVFLKALMGCPNSLA